MGAAADPSSSDAAYPRGSCGKLGIIPTRATRVGEADGICISEPLNLRVTYGTILDTNKDLLLVHPIEHQPKDGQGECTENGWFDSRPEDVQRFDP
jgi:hypothetical protein